MPRTLISNFLSITNIIYLGNIIIFLNIIRRCGNAWMTQNFVMEVSVFYDENNKKISPDIHRKVYFLLSMDTYVMSEKPT